MDAGNVKFNFAFIIFFVLKGAGQSGTLQQIENLFETTPHF